MQASGLPKFNFLASPKSSQSKQAGHDIRYDIAEEFVTIQYGFREGNWQDEAVCKDRVNAVHLCEPSPQRTLLLYQAGASSKGAAFAARHAECVFVVGHSRSQLAKSVANLRRLAVEAGRAPADIKIFALMTIITAASDAEAEAKAADYRQNDKRSQRVAFMKP